MSGQGGVYFDCRIRSMIGLWNWKLERSVLGSPWKTLNVRPGWNVHPWTEGSFLENTNYFNSWLSEIWWSLFWPMMFSRPCIEAHLHPCLAAKWTWSFYFGALLHLESFNFIQLLRTQEANLDKLIQEILKIFFSCSSNIFKSHLS